MSKKCIHCKIELKTFEKLICLKCLSENDERAFLLREKLEKKQTKDIMGKLFGKTFEKSNLILDEYIKFKEKFVKYCTLIQKEYKEHYLCNGGFGLTGHLSFLLDNSTTKLIANPLSYARYLRDNGKEDSIDWDYYQKGLKIGLEAEKDEVKFLKSLTKKQLYDMLTTGGYII